MASARSNAPAEISIRSGTSVHIRAVRPAGPIDEAEHRPIERQLLHVTGGIPVCQVPGDRLVVGDQHPAGPASRSTWPTTGRLAAPRRAAHDRHLGAAVRRTGRESAHPPAPGGPARSCPRSGRAGAARARWRWAASAPPGLAAAPRRSRCISVPRRSALSARRRRPAGPADAARRRGSKAKPRARRHSGGAS